LKVRVASTDDLLPGGLMMVRPQDVEMVLCNYEGTYHALERRCGHMSAPLEMGTLNQYILTCPMHGAQFSVINGEVINDALPRNRTPAKMDGPVPVHGYLAMLIEKVKTMDVKTYTVTVEGDNIFVDV